MRVDENEAFATIEMLFEAEKPLSAVQATEVARALIRK